MGHRTRLTTFLPFRSLAYRSPVRVLSSVGAFRALFG